MTNTGAQTRAIFRQEIIEFTTNKKDTFSASLTQELKTLSLNPKLTQAQKNGLKKLCVPDIVNDVSTKVIDNYINIAVQLSHPNTVREQPTSLNIPFLSKAEAVSKS
jgi:hypothetical protein